MKKETSFQKLSWICAATGLLFLLFFAVLCFGSKSRQVDALTSSVPSSYVVGVYEEKIAVFTQGDRVPIEIYNVYVGTLPQADQNALRAGIRVTGREKLREVIEDYTS